MENLSPNTKYHIMGAQLMSRGTSARTSGFYLNQQPLPFFPWYFPMLGQTQLWRGRLCPKEASLEPHSLDLALTLCQALLLPAQPIPPTVVLLWIRNATHPQPPCPAEPAPGLHPTSEIPHSAISHSFPQSLGFSLEKHFFFKALYSKIL